MWKCRICDTENEDDTVVCSECGSYKEEDYDIYSDLTDEEDMEDN